jgi:hypothetical protein
MNNGKLCIECQSEKDLSGFHRNSARKDGLSSRCKPCENTRMRAYQTQWKLSNPKKWKMHQDKARIKYRYGLLMDEYNELLLSQDGKCAVCDTEFIKSPCIDHSHSTGEVRGLLCDACNRGLGYFKENANRLRNAAQYVEKYKG